QNDVGRKRDHFRRVSARARGVRHAPANVDLYVAAFGPAQLLQSLQKSRDTRLTLRVVRDLPYEHANAPQTLTLLRARHQRQIGSRAANEPMNSRPLMACPFFGSASSRFQ